MLSLQVLKVQVVEVKKRYGARRNVVLKSRMDGIWDLTGATNAFHPPSDEQR